MSTKYLGEQFDIHGGGMDLIPTHHTNEVAQSVACNHKEPAKYWLHTNMLTVNGQKMSKSLGNSFLPEELFRGDHELLDRGYSPMTVRYFMLQAHYSSTLDFTNEALQAAEKGYRKLMAVNVTLQALTPSGKVEEEQVRQAQAAMVKMYEGMNNDFNTAQTLAAMNEVSALVNTWGVKGKQAHLPADVLKRMKDTFDGFVFDIFGLKEEKEGDTAMLDGVMGLVIDIRKQARSNKDFATSDKIRDSLQAAGIVLKDSKEGTTWELA
jgi:cysteinyl-tRNA synthetase